MDKKTIEQSARILVGEMLIYPEIAKIMGLLKNYDLTSFRHSINVGFISAQMGMERGLKKEQLEQLTIGALLHDIGKIKIDKNILNKKGPLTKEEYLRIKEHPRLGYCMLENKQVSHVALDIILHHHERMNGSGYPDGLKETQIPITTQMVSVADVWDAMTAERSYKRELTGCAAYEELRNGAKSRYNDAMIRVLMKVEDK